MSICIFSSFAQLAAKVEQWLVSSSSNGLIQANSHSAFADIYMAKIKRRQMEIRYRCWLLFNVLILFPFCFDYILTFE